MVIRKFFLSAICLLTLSCYATQNTQENPQEIALKTPAKGTVALTFDDGPNPDFTLKYLAVLKKYNVRATFFVVGMQAEKYPDVIKQLFAAGMAIASHSQTHPDLTKISAAQLQIEISQPAEIIANITGKKPLCLRYPFGASNQHVIDVIRAHDIVPGPMGWNAYDYKLPGVDKIVNQVLNNLQSGTIIIMHDGFAGLDRQQTLEALPLIIEGIQKKGLGFSVICDNNLETTTASR